MRQYAVRRLLLFIPTMIGVTIVIFATLRFLPGDVIDQITGEYGAASPEVREQLERQYSLDANWAEQYGIWIGDLITGDLGTSILSGQPITNELRVRMPVTLELGVLALLVSFVVAVPVGTISALKQDSFIDYLFRGIAVAFLALPSFWVATLAIAYGFTWFGWTPPLSYYPPWENLIANLRILWLPAIILGMSLSGITMRLVRSTMLEVLRQDYIRTARSKGIAHSSVVTRHAFRNAAIPVVTVIGLQVPIVVGGTVILERIFSLPGMGTYLLQSIQARDYPVVQAIVLVSATAVIVSNIVVDLTYPLIDPRVRMR